jgi:rhamnosyltransferase subunit B
MKPVNFLFLPVGSDGDVRPFIGLAKALRARGHGTITFGINPNFRKAIESEGFQYEEVGSEAQWRSVIGDLHLYDMSGLVIRLFHGMVLPVLDRQYELARLYGGKQNAIVVTSNYAYGARLGQEKDSIALITAHLYPLTLEPTFPRDANEIICRALNGIRSRFRLAPIQNAMQWQNSPEGILCLFPKWWALSPDWPKNIWLTQFPLPRESPAHLPQLESFLKPGKSALVFTSGTVLEQAPAFYAAAIETCNRLNKPGIFLSRAAVSLPGPLPENVRSFDFLPLSPVLARTSAIVHHGGVGTSSLAMRAGVPQLVVPFFGDQFDTAYRLRILGVADTLDWRELEGQRMADKLQRLMTSNEVRQRCGAIAARLKNVDSFTEACEAVERYAVGRGLG